MLRRRQVSAFVALLALDTQRIAQRRLDVAPCVRLPESWLVAEEEDELEGGGSGAGGPANGAGADGDVGIVTVSSGKAVACSLCSDVPKSCAPALQIPWNRWLQPGLGTPLPA